MSATIPVPDDLPDDLPDGLDAADCIAAVALPSGASLGRSGEDAALTHLIEVHGLELVARNHRIALDELRGELDLVVRDPRSGLLVVCEVKSRTRAQTRDGASVTLGERQQGRIRRITAVLLATGALTASRVRFDLVAVDLGGGRSDGRARLRHLPDAW
jgi:Holliday junction resolvase-like predicted endonuclease